MKELLQRSEIPKEFNRETLSAKYPTATIVGDTYGFFYYIEATNTVFIDYGWKSLMDKVKAHMIGNGLEVPSELGLIMQEEFCQHKPEFCSERSKESEEKVSAWHLMKRFYTSAVVPLATGNLVDQTEANRRAEICAACPKNTDKVMEFCVGCSSRSLIGTINSYLTSRHTPSDHLLKNCLVCHCLNAIKVWVPKSEMDTEDLRPLWPDHCWMK